MDDEVRLLPATLVQGYTEEDLHLIVQFLRPMRVIDTKLNHPMKITLSDILWKECVL